MTQRREKNDRRFDEHVEITNPDGQHGVVLACEHASAFIPEQLDDLGLSNEARYSHIAWDPGALDTASHLSKLLDATLVHSCVSRLVYDCNRDPSSPTAMPTRSEIHDVPGNHNLSSEDRDARVQNYYTPFKKTLSNTLTGRQRAPVLVTIHSFTALYHGKQRETEIGILHDTDTRLADALLAVADKYIVHRNEPYGPDDDVTHTLKIHALPAHYLNVMIEIRNDLLTTQDDCEAVAQSLAKWIEQALANINAASNTTEHARR